MNIIIAGPQGSGKGTQAVLLAEKFGLIHCEIGNLLRQAAKEKTPIGEKIAKFINQGKIVPNKITFSLIENFLMEKNLKKGIVFDGFPRRISQLFWLERKLKERKQKIDYFIYLKLSKKEVLRRLSGRRGCPQCGRIYNLLTMPPKKDELCDDCGVPLVVRADDTPAAILKRLENYKTATEPMIAYLKEKKRVIVINGEPPVEEVFRQIIKKIS